MKFIPTQLFGNSTIDNWNSIIDNLHRLISFGNRVLFVALPTLKVLWTQRINDWVT